MATPFRLKRSAIASKRPATTDLQLGELALNTYDGYLYTEREGVGLATVTNLTPWYENYGGGSIYYSNSVGIGTTVPQYNLDVRKGSIGGYDTLVAQHSDVIKEIAVTVASKTDDHRYQGQGSGNGYVLDGIQSPVLTLTPGRTYKFNLSSSDMSSHPFRFYLDEAKSVQYTTNVTTTSTSAQITITDDTPNILHYQCSSHGYMGNALIINSNVINTPYAAIIRNGLDVLSGNVDISSNLDVDGNTTLDITTIDGLLDINAGGQANTFKVEDLTAGRVVIAGTGGELEDSGNLLFNGTDLSAASLIVSDLTSGRVVIAGGSGAVEDNANLKFNTTTSEFEVVGHTILDSLNVSGISTFTGDIDADAFVIAGSTGTGGIKVGTSLQIFDASHTAIRQQNSGSIFIDADNIELRNRSAGGFRAYAKFGSWASGAAGLFHDDGSNSNERLRTTSTGVSITGNVSAVDGAFSGNLTVTGNVGIAGTLTYEDVDRIDAVGLSTFREGLFIPDNQKAQFGNAAGSADLNIYHSGNNAFLINTTGFTSLKSSNGILYLSGNSTHIRSGDDGETQAVFNDNGSVDLYFNNVKKFETSLKGIKVGTGVTIETNGQATFAGIVTATKFIGDGSDLTGIDASALKFGGSVKAQANGFGVVVTGVTTSSGGFSGNLSGTATLATDLAINGTNQLLYQASNNDSAILPTGNSGQILQSNGAGSAPQWVTSAPAGAIEGITIREESSVIGSANSISTINFIGESVTADAAVAAGIATVTINALSGILVKDGGANVGTGITAFDFAGSLVDVDAVSNTGIATVQIDGLSVKDEGSSVGTAGSITTLNFVGAGIVVDAAANAGVATITSAGGATTDDVVALAIALG